MFHQKYEHIAESFAGFYESAAFAMYMVKPYQMMLNNWHMCAEAHETGNYGES